MPTHRAIAAGRAMPPNDHDIIRVFLNCPAGHRLGHLYINRSNTRGYLRLVAAKRPREHRQKDGAVSDESLHYAPGKRPTLRYRCPSCCQDAARWHRTPPAERAIPWRTVAALAAALTCDPTGNLNRTVTATPGDLLAAWRAIVPPDEPLPTRYADLRTRWLAGPDLAPSA